MSQNAIFKAIAHPARREILSLLAAKDLSVKELTATFAISQPAVSQHLQGLRDARLVTCEKVGMEHRYRLTAKPLKVVFEWSSQYRSFFDPSGHVWNLTSGVKKPPSVRRYRNHGG
jgi:DNA-binding transcriptional ArsR family regulator